MGTDSIKEREVWDTIVSGLSGLDKDAQARILQSAMTFLGIGGLAHRAKDEPAFAGGDMVAGREEIGFSNREDMSAKEFMLDKEPRTNTERIACLGYYLTHFRGTRHFRTLDVSKLNMEAAQQKFTNPAQAMKDATRAGMLVPVSKGKKQLSAMGEQFVQALPDHEVSKRVQQQIRWRRAKRRVTRKQPSA